MHYYQQKDIPENSCTGREREFLAKLFWALSADGELLNWENFPADAHYIDVLAEPPSDPPWNWLTLEDFEFYLQEYLGGGADTTFIGGINAYRVMDRNWELFRDTAQAEIALPALFVGGSEDPVVKLGSPEEFTRMQALVKDLRGMELLSGAGHFLQQEQPAALNRQLLTFLSSL